MEYITVTKEAKRAQLGKDILAIDTQATNAINQLTSIMLNIKAIRQTMVDMPTIFTETDVAELDTSVDTKIIEIDDSITQIKAMR